MSDEALSAVEQLDKPVDIAMPHSTSDVRDLADVMRSLANAIDGAIELINGAYADTEDGGWEDQTADRFRASLVVGRGNASDLEEDARTYAQKLDAYADALAAADERLDRAHDVAEAADLLDGTVVHPPEKGLFLATEGIPDASDEEIKRRRTLVNAYTFARAEFDAAVIALEDADGIPALAQAIGKQIYFSSASFVKGEIEDVAEVYNQGTPHPRFTGDIGTGQVYDELLELPDDLVLRSLKSYGGSVLNVFGVAFDVYTGSSVPKAVFVGATGALAGHLTSKGFALTLRLFRYSWTPPGWVLIAISGGATLGAGLLAGSYWDNSLPDPVKKWIQEQRELGEEKEEASRWRDAYNAQSPTRGIQLEGP